MKSIFFVIIVIILCFINCSGGGEEIVALAKQEISTGLNNGNINISSSINLSPKAAIRASSGLSHTPKIDLVGNWGTADDLYHIHFQDSGQGIYIVDKKHNGHIYSYYKDFNWKHSGIFVYITYTTETAVRDGNQLIREKTMSEQTTYKISGSNLIVDDISFQKK